jgi:hypothetical protein
VKSERGGRETHFVIREEADLLLVQTSKLIRHLHSLVILLAFDVLREEEEQSG